MNQDLIRPIVERIELGHSKESIKNEVLGYGYSAAEFEAAYASALGSTQGANVPGAIPQRQESQEGGEVTHAEPSSAKKVLLPFFIALLVVFVVGGVALAARMGYMSIPFLSGAPFNEDKIIEEVVRSLGEIETATYTATLAIESAERDEDVSEIPEQFIEAPEDEWGMSLAEVWGGMIPPDFKVNFSLSGTLENDSELSPNSYTQLTADLTTDDFAMHGDVEFITTSANDVYIRVNRIPSLFFDLSGIKGEWVHVVTPDDVDEETADLFDDQSGELFLEQFKLLSELAQKHSYLVVVGSPTKEQINGESVYRYQLAVNAESADAFYKETYETLEREYGEDSLWYGSTVHDLEMRTSNAYIEHMNHHAPMYVFARRDGTIARMAVDARLAFGGDEVPALADRQVNVYLAIDLSDVNEPTSVTVPGDALTLEEAAERVPFLGLMMGSMNEARVRGEDAAKKASVNVLRAEAELHWDENWDGNRGSYENFCVVAEGLVAENNPDWHFHCEDTPTSYLAEVELANGDYHCVDYTGFSGEIWVSSEGEGRCAIDYSTDLMFESLGGEDGF